MDILNQLQDSLAMVKAARERGYQFTVSQTLDRIDISIWWDPTKAVPVAPDQGIALAFAPPKEPCPHGHEREELRAG